MADVTSVQHFNKTLLMTPAWLKHSYLKPAFITLIYNNNVLVPATLYSPPEGERGCLPGNVQHRVNAVRSHYLLIISSSLRASGPKIIIIIIIIIITRMWIDAWMKIDPYYQQRKYSARSVDLSSCELSDWGWNPHNLKVMIKLKRGRANLRSKKKAM